MEAKTVCAPRLLRQRTHGLYTYGPLASEYVIGFEKKWMEGQRPNDEPLVVSAEFLLAIRGEDKVREHRFHIGFLTVVLLSG